MIPKRSIHWYTSAIFIIQKALQYQFVLYHSKITSSSLGYRTRIFFILIFFSNTDFSSGVLQVPVDVVIDHSVRVDVAKCADALKQNMDLEFSRNKERFSFFKWASSAFNNMLVLPPGSGILHQVSDLGPGANFCTANKYPV